MQTEREKTNAVDMHTTFQEDLVKLRLATAKAYMKVLTDGQVCPSVDPNDVQCEMYKCSNWNEPWFGTRVISFNTVIVMGIYNKYTLPLYTC